MCCATYCLKIRWGVVYQMSSYNHVILNIIHFYDCYRFCILQLGFALVTIDTLFTGLDLCST